MVKAGGLIRRISLFVAALLLLTTASSATTFAAAPPQRGLLITPIRQFVSVAAGSTESAKFTVINDTAKPMVVSFSVKEFSVADYTYDFKFDEQVGIKLLTLGLTEATLQPGKSQIVNYDITVPRGSTPGGRYYTVLATATSNISGGIREQIQAASLVYITIEGQLKYTNNIGATTVDNLVFKPQINFTMDVSNTGNTHYFMYLDAHLRGLLTSKSKVSGSHLLLPIKTRHFESSVPSPLLPGIYKLQYGYRTEHTASVMRTAWIVFIPPWSIAALILLAWLGRLIRVRRAIKEPETTPTDS